MGKVRFVTHGCKANQYDTRVLREALTRRRWAERDRAGVVRPDHGMDGLVGSLAHKTIVPEMDLPTGRGHGARWGRKQELAR